MHGLSTSFSICPHFGECAGCCEHLSLKPPPIWEEILSFFSFLSPKLHMGSPTHWRHRAKVAVRGRSHAPLIGLFKRFSHDVFPIPHCLVHHPRLNQAFECVRNWIKKNEIIPYEEDGGKGELRYIQGVVQRISGHVQLSLVLNSSQKYVARWQTLLAQLVEEHPSLWHSLWINFNDQPTNTIFGSEWILAWGEKYLWEKFGEVNACYGPASFGQANLPLFERMLIHLRALLPPRARVAEFYAGVGVIGLFIASHCQWVRCCEINPFAEEYFRQACTKLPLDISSRLSFFSNSTDKCLVILEDATTVIVDPPRKGLDQHFFKALQDASTVNQLLYISCGWNAFQRDCQRLKEDGWQVQSVDGYHFFPGSDHVELLVNFVKEI